MFIDWEFSSMDPTFEARGGEAWLNAKIR